ncbi:TolB family protein [Hymenobacter sp. B1770]|uniref:TolB family protein n=1 Tax=Hymenobacter sp. B1770 TaxID=1718788 RepID=UPI003CE99A79
MKRLIVFCCCLLSLCAAAQPSTDIYLFDLTVKAGTVVLSKPRNVTPHPGYDNQPFFHVSQPVLYYTSSGEGGRTDLKSYNYRTALTQQLTSTPDREYSPILTDDQQFLSCIIQRDNGQQDLGKYPLAGGPPIVLIDNLKVGYHAWIDQTRLLLFVLATPVNELHYHDLATGLDTVVARNIGRSLKRIPNQSAISFLEQTPEGTWLIRRFDTQTRAVTTLGPALAGAEDVAWTRNGLMLMSNGEQIYCRRPGSSQSWQPVTIKGAAPALKRMSRLATNAANDKLAVVVAD